MTRKNRHAMSDAEAEDAINRLLVESGERDRLRTKLSRQLEQCGWREQVKLQVKEIVREKGPDIAMEDLIQQTAPRATSKVPEKVKEDLTRDIKKFLDKNAQDY